MTRENRFHGAVNALDLFCAAGGATKGLQRAGFHVTGVDIAKQPRYCGDAFMQGDALTVDLSEFDFVWASPPCQAHTSMRVMHNARRHQDLIPAVRAKLQAWGGPYIIENVPGAVLRNPVMLCGTMFSLGTDGAELRRHRVFESNLLLMAPGCQHGRQPRVIGIYGGHKRNRRRTYGERGDHDFSLEEARQAMGIEWMSLSELSQAIPPAYSEFLGRHVMQVLRNRKQAASQPTAPGEG